MGCPHLQGCSQFVDAENVEQADRPHCLTHGGSEHRPETVVSGELAAVLPNTYLAAPVADDPAWLTAAVGWNPNAVVCGPAAAGLSFWPELRVPEIDVAVRTRIERSGYRFWRRQIPAEFLARRNGILLTNPAITAVDMIVSHGGEVIDRVLRSRMARLPHLWEAVAATTFRSGNVDRRKLLIDSKSEPWSEAERLADRILRAAGLGGWRTNHRLVVCGTVRYIDIAFTDVKLAIEIDGYQYHSDPDSFRRDRIRHNQLVRGGWRVLHFTYQTLVDDPEGVAELISTMISRR